MLPLLKFCSDSCFYGDSFYKMAAHERCCIYMPMVVQQVGLENMLCRVWDFRCALTFIVTFLKKWQQTGFQFLKRLFKTSGIWPPERLKMCMCSLKTTMEIWNPFYSLSGIVLRNMIFILRSIWKHCSKA